MLILPAKYQQLWDNFPTICNELKVELCQFLLDTEQQNHNEFIGKYCTYFQEEGLCYYVPI